MESFETQVKKYKREIDSLEKENAALAKRADAGEKISIGRQLEQNKILSEYNELLRFVDSLPDDIKRQVRAQEQQKTQNHQR